MADLPQGYTADYQTPAYAASGVVKATPGRLYRVYGYNSKASAQFVCIFDAVAVPADTAVPKIILSVGATANFNLDLGDLGWGFLVGICWSNSSTGPTKTLGSADCWVNITYR